ncbi:inositol 1,4,5-triphosphate receptor associated 2 isoform X8 [Gallus gallus]|uniref:inositol 1,4,5-triphosphate receptor associated 2 isoform X8 n=1 Tax=Gallus gallus TaxID=9031 RepID=UPI000739E1B7|nr:inositol 1,4,5-triphosphate receptor associated 2 isoform X8 [Gallus gallus]|eukprot:XP_015154228.1 lymphoid-restricted membrane protein isoform X5 [Gallus gallus]
MKPRVDTSLGVGKEVWGRAQGRAAWRQRRGCRQSPPQSREQQAEPARLLAAPDEGRMSSPQEHLDRVLAGSKESMGSISEEPGTELAFCTGDGDGIEEDEETPEELLLSFPSELSVLERLGLHSTNLTEQDVEAAFAHLALAFRCDMFTLQQRAQVEKRAQDAAEENIQEELGQCQTFLERLSTSCMDVSCKEVLEQLQCSLAVLAAAIKRATSAAEKLGAVHQEARMSRAAEVMVQHVDNLKRHHLREHAELEEMKCLIQQNSRNRQLAETQDDAEQQLRPHPLMRGFQQASARRRVSIAVIPKQLVPASGVDGRETLAGRPKGAQRQTSTQRSKLEPPSQGSVVSKGLVVEAGGKELESSAGGEELGQLRMMSKESPVELWQPWLFISQPYWVVFCLLLLSVALLLLLHLLELQWLQPSASPKA